MVQICKFADLWMHVSKNSKYQCDDFRVIDGQVYLKYDENNETVYNENSGFDVISLLVKHTPL